MKIKQTLLALALLSGISSTVLSSVALAVTCGGVQTSIIDCKEEGGGTCPNNPEGSKYLTKAQVDAGTLCDDKSTPDRISGTGVWGILLLIINIMTAGVGVLAVGGVIYGSILYTTATDSMEQKKKGKVIIFNVVLGIFVYALMYSFLNFIVPGGIFT